MKTEMWWSQSHLDHHHMTRGRLPACFTHPVDIRITAAKACSRCSTAWLHSHTYHARCRVLRWLKAFADERSLAWQQDAVGNLVIKRTGSGGGETAPAVVIQACQPPNACHACAAFRV